MPKGSILTKSGQQVGITFDAVDFFEACEEAEKQTGCFFHNHAAATVEKRAKHAEEMQRLAPTNE